MANINSVQHAQWQPPNYAPLKPNEKEGRLRCLFASVTFQGALIGDKIIWGKIPVGARVMGGFVRCGATLGAGVTLTLEDDDAVPNSFFAATSFAAATFRAIGAAAADLAGHEMPSTGAGLIKSSIAGGNPTNGTTATMGLWYVVD